MKNPSQNRRVGIDIGGTFTDLVALADDGRLIRRKVASTPQAPEDGLLDAKIVSRCVNGAGTTAA